MLVEKHHGEVPGNLEELVVLPGVGRKTPMSFSEMPSRSWHYGYTHVGRLSRRLGLTEHEDPVKVEQDLMS